MKRTLFCGSLIAIGFLLGILVSNLTRRSNSSSAAVVATSQTPAIDARIFADKIARDPNQIMAVNK